MDRSCLHKNKTGLPFRPFKDTVAEPVCGPTPNREGEGIPSYESSKSWNEYIRWEKCLVALHNSICESRFWHNVYFRWNEGVA